MKKKMSICFWCHFARNSCAYVQTKKCLVLCGGVSNVVLESSVVEPKCSGSKSCRNNDVLIYSRA